MNLNDLATFIILSYVTYRVTRFCQKDSLLEEPRSRFFQKLLGPPQAMSFDISSGPPQFKPTAWWRIKIYELLTCPYCWSVWVAAGAVIISDQFISIPLPVFFWVAVAGGAMSVWRQVEDE